MDDRNEGTCRSRIIFTGILLPVLVSGPMIFAFYLYGKRVTMESYVAKAKAVCLTADSVNSCQGCEFMPTTAGDNSFDLTFTDRRSPGHKQPGDNGPIDFYVVDRTKNLLLYTHFVKARKTCLDCHGDPRRSKKLWANQNSPKRLSGDLAGWAEGDVCGTYEVVAPLSDADKKVASASVIAALMLLAGINISTLGFYSVMSHAVNQRRKEENPVKEAACSDSELYDFDRADKVSERVY